MYVIFKTNKLPASLNAGHSGTAAAHAVIQHHITCIGISPDKVFADRYWLLRRVVFQFPSAGIGYQQDIMGKAFGTIYAFPFGVI